MRLFLVSAVVALVSLAVGPAAVAAARTKTAAPIGMRQLAVVM